MRELELSEVAAGVHELRLPIPWEDGHVNCFLLPAGRRIDMIDCGMSSEESLQLILAAIKRLGGPRGKVGRLFVTHIHPDHYGAAGELVENEGAEVFLHRLEVPMVLPRYLEIEQLVEEVGRYLLLHGVPEEVASPLKNASRGIRDYVKPAQPALQLDGSETIELGRHQLRVEWTPGHSPGHVCLFDPALRLLFAGDQLLPDASPNIGLHPQSTPDPLDDYLRGLNRMAALKPGLVLPAHGRPFNGAPARVRALAEHHRRRKQQILEVIADREMSGWEVAVAIWGERKNVFEMRMALQEGLAHLQSLSHEGSLEKRATPARVSWRR